MITIKSDKHPFSWVFRAQMAVYNAEVESFRQGLSPDDDPRVLLLRQQWYDLIPQALAEAAKPGYEEIPEFLMGIFTFFQRFPDTPREGLNRPEHATNTNRNMLEGIQCPRCGQFDVFKIGCRVVFEVTDDCVLDHGDVEWDNVSYCECPSCLYTDQLRAFQQ